MQVNLNIKVKNVNVIVIVIASFSLFHFRLSWFEILNSLGLLNPRYATVAIV